jgi:hypothetical protein
MNRNTILDAMEKKAKEVYEGSPEYVQNGKRGMLVVEIKDPEIPGQWDSTSRGFGIVFRDYTFDGELVINNGTNFDALAHGKIAFSRRKGLDSGTNYYQVLGYESFLKGSIISDDGKCICAFAGFSQDDDKTIAEAGITCYESLKRSEPDYSSEAEEDEDDEEIDEQTDESVITVPKRAKSAKSPKSKAKSAKGKTKGKR